MGYKVCETCGSPYLAELCHLRASGENQARIIFELKAQLEAVREWRHRKKTHLMKTKIPVGRAGLLELSHILSDLPNSGEDQLNTLSHPGKGGG